MSELVERYVHQVGRYLPKRERAEIEAELRSLIRDQLDDRFAGSPSEAEVATVLAELGNPQRMAASYLGEQYLVGPSLYPYLMIVLRNGWLVVPSVVIFLNAFGVLASDQDVSLASLVIAPFLAGVQATLIFSAIVILTFAVIQQAGGAFEQKADAFDPLSLPEIDDPSVVDRVEAVSGVVIGTFMTLVLLYFIQVGGLALPFSPEAPDRVIPAPVSWLLLLMAAVVAMVLLHLVVLRRNRWSSGLWFVETVLEALGTIGLYFAVLEPIAQRLAAGSSYAPLIESVPELLVVGYAVLTFLTRGVRLVKLWTYSNNNQSSLMG